MCMPRIRSVADGRQLLPLNGCLKRSAGERGVAEEKGEEGVREEGGRKEGGRGRGEREKEEENKVLDAPSTRGRRRHPTKRRKEGNTKETSDGWMVGIFYLRAADKRPAKMASSTDTTCKQDGRRKTARRWGAPPPSG